MTIKKLNVESLPSSVAGDTGLYEVCDLYICRDTEMVDLVDFMTELESRGIVDLSWTSDDHGLYVWAGDENYALGRIGGRIPQAV